MSATRTRSIRSAAGGPAIDVRKERERIRKERASRERRRSRTDGKAVLWAQTVPSWPMMAAEVRWWPSISHMRCSSTYVCHDILSGGLVAAATCKEALRRRRPAVEARWMSVVGGRERSVRSRTQVSRGEGRGINRGEAARGVAEDCIATTWRPRPRPTTRSIASSAFNLAVRRGSPLVVSCPHRQSGDGRRGDMARLDAPGNSVYRLEWLAGHQNLTFQPPCTMPPPWPKAPAKLLLRLGWASSHQNFRYPRFMFWFINPLLACFLANLETTAKCQHSTIS